MPCTSLIGTCVSRTRAVCTPLGLLLLTCNACGAATSQTTSCALVAPNYQSKAGVAQFEITVECAPNLPGAKPFPVGVDVLVGLTIYAGAGVNTSPMNSADNFSRRVVDAPPEIKAALDRATQSKAVLTAGFPKWIVLTDEGAESHDFAAKVLRVEKAGMRITLRFEDDEKAIAGKQHFLFAAWPGTERKPCKKAAKYARSGCRRYGYVIGSGAGVQPIAAYPGLEINHFEHPSGEAWTSERWIVERFR